MFKKLSRDMEEIRKTQIEFIDENYKAWDKN